MVLETTRSGWWSTKMQQLIGTNSAVVETLHAAEVVEHHCQTRQQSHLQTRGWHEHLLVKTGQASSDGSETGHEARMCPQKPAPRAPLKSIEDAPRHLAVMCVTDADGFRTLPPRLSGQRLVDFIASTPAPRCNSNRFAPLSL